MVRIALAFLLCATSCTMGCTAVEPPNFLVIVVDDLGWADVGFNNPSTFYETPALDRLAKRSVVFRQAYAAGPVCSPTRASLLTGKDPLTTGITDFMGARTPERVLGRPNYPHPLLPATFRRSLDASEITVADRLLEAGYRTFFAGKWHVGDRGQWPENQGFEINRGGWSAGAPTGDGRYFSPYGNPRLGDGPAGEHLPTRLAAETAAFLTENRDERFLAWLSFYSVHTPLMGREDLVDKYANRAAPADSFRAEHSRRDRRVQNHAVYAAMIEAMDQAIGTVLDRLDSLGLAENTVVVFISDNGGLSTSEGHPTSNLPLRAGKGWLYEGGIRVPFLVAGPGISANVEDRAVTSSDLLPTVVELAGLTPQPNVDGRSLTPLLQPEQDWPDRDLVWHYPHYSHQGGPPASAIRSGPYKYLEYYEGDQAELYDLATDPGEQRNLIADLPSEAARLRATLTARLDAASAVYPEPHPTNSVGAEVN